MIDELKEAAFRALEKSDFDGVIRREDADGTPNDHGDFVRLDGTFDLGVIVRAVVAAKEGTD